MINLDAETHIYSHVQQRVKKDQTISITQVISFFQQPFESQKIAERISKRTGRKIEDIIQEWEWKKNFASIYGNWCHDFINNYFKLKCHLQSAFEQTSLENYLTQIKNLPQQFSSLFLRAVEHFPRQFSVFEQNFLLSQQIRCLLTEQILDYEIDQHHSHLFGKLDFLGIQTNDSQQHLFLLDFKTGSNFRFFSPWHQKMRYLLSAYDDCHLTTYSLQLWFYYWLLQQRFPQFRYKQISKHLYIVWFPFLFETNANNKAPYTLIEAQPELWQEVPRILSWIKQYTTIVDNQIVFISNIMQNLDELFVKAVLQLNEIKEESLCTATAKRKMQNRFEKSLINLIREQKDLLHTLNLVTTMLPDKDNS